MSPQIANLKYIKTQYLDLYLQDQPGRPLGGLSDSIGYSENVPVLNCIKY